MIKIDNLRLSNKDICCYCGEKTRYTDGYTIWETFDGKYGHQWCVQDYDKQNKPRKMKIEEEIRSLDGNIRHYEYEIRKCQEEIEKLKIELGYIED